ncbi:MAG: hypothetical protein FIB04_11510 [Gammaproteobacteria bacterium]|nr:hypothetical protein [Gammaproteobacteria bacterium]
MPVLTRSLKRQIALLALLALLFAQAAAGLHALKHLGARNDSPGIPDAHSQLCLACVSFAPLASAHGGTTVSFDVASLGVESFVRAAAPVAAEQRHHFGFRSRAPPG